MTCQVIALVTLLRPDLVESDPLPCRWSAVQVVLGHALCEGCAEGIEHLLLKEDSEAN